MLRQGIADRLAGTRRHAVLATLAKALADGCGLQGFGMELSGTGDRYVRTAYLSNLHSKSRSTWCHHDKCLFHSRKCPGGRTLLQGSTYLPSYRPRRCRARAGVEGAEAAEAAEADADRRIGGILRRNHANTLHGQLLQGLSNQQHRSCDNRCSNPPDALGYRKRREGCPNDSCCSSRIAKLGL
jgi:hypothetical protein